MHRNKLKGTIFEYDFMHVLQMMSFECIRAYSSIGVADLIFSPPWNIKKNYRALLVQNKNSKSEDYIDPFESDKLTNLQQRNSGLVIVAFKRDHNIMIKIWDTSEILTFEKFILREYGIVCDYSKILKSFKEYHRPIHLYPTEKEIYIGRDGREKEKPIAPFADFLSHVCRYFHVPEHFNENYQKWKDSYSKISSCA